MSDQKNTYFSETMKCPVCDELFKIERMLTGRGRLNADTLTDELRRIYKPSQKYGKVNPLNYLIIVCPNCLYGAMENDFHTISPQSIDKIKLDIAKRKSFFNEAFGAFNFKKERTDKEGLVSFLIAIYSYGFFPSKYTPSVKIALSSLRGAWICSDLYTETKDIVYKKIAENLYVKAYKYYNKAYLLLNKGQENLDIAGFLGPDLDKNYGFNGFLYMYCILLYKYGLKSIPDAIERIKAVNDAKIILSRVFGIGKSSKEKNVFFLDMARKLYEQLNEYLKTEQ